MNQLTNMHPIFYVLIPVGIMAAALGLHYWFQYRSWQRELREDEEKKKHVDYLLGSDDVQEWYEREYPNNINH